MTSEYPRIRVAGEPRARGFQYGEAARDRIKLSLEAYAAIFMHYSGWQWSEVVLRSLRFEPAIAAYAPSCLEEMRGIAAGAGVPFESILALNARTELMFSAARIRARHGSLPHECSSFATLGESNARGGTLIGQNWDWLVHCRDTTIVLEALCSAGPSYVTVVEAGLLAKAGFNSAGLGLVTNALVSQGDGGEPGVPYHVLLRSVLDAESVQQALQRLRHAHRASSANYLIAHADGSAVDVEAGPGGTDQAYCLEARRGLLLHTNHILSPDFEPRDLSRVAMPETDSPFRYRRMLELLVDQHGSLGPEQLQRLLADHVNFPYSVCCHPNERLAPHEQGTTLASLIMDLGSRQMWLADGCPCRSQYRLLDYRAIL